MKFKTNVQLKSVNNRKLYIFDLDETLWDGYQLYPNVLDILQELHIQGHLMYIASFNLDVPSVLKRLNITNLFHGGAYGQDRSKYKMIREIVSKVLENHRPVAVEFYDDLMSNVVDVHQKSNGNVRSVHVGNTGLNRTHLNTNMPLKFMF